MMPKGVEHNNAVAALTYTGGVRIPMMPKGVEHLLLLLLLLHQL